MPLARRHALRRRLAVLVLGVVAVIAAEVSLPGVEPRSRDGDRSGRQRQRLRPQPPGGRVRPSRPDVREGSRLRPRPVRRGRGAWRKVAGAEACALVGQPKGFGFAATVDVRAVPGPASPVDRGGQLLRVPARPLARGRPRRTSVRRPGQHLRDPVRDRWPLRRVPDDGPGRGAVPPGRRARHDAGRRGRRPAAACRAQVGRDADDRRLGGLARQRRARPATTGADGRRRTGPSPDRARRPARRLPGQARPAGRARGRARDQPRPRLRPPRPGRRPTEPPDGTPVMLVLPYVEVSSDPVVVSSWSRQFGGWMRSVAAGRSAHLCRGLAGVRAVAPRPAPGRHPPAERRRVRLGPLDRRPVGRECS